MVSIRWRSERKQCNREGVAFLAGLHPGDCWLYSACPPVPPTKQQNLTNMQNQILLKILKGLVYIATVFFSSLAIVVEHHLRTHMMGRDVEQEDVPQKYCCWHVSRAYLYDTRCGQSTVLLSVDGRHQATCRCQHCLLSTRV